MNTSDLRPLGVGEILDRAVTIFVRNFASIALVLAVVLAPLAVLQFVVHPDWSGYFTSLQKVLATAPGHAADQQRVIREMNAKIFPNGWTLATTFVAYFGVLGAHLATLIAFGDILAGRAVSLRSVYRETARRYVAALIVGLLFIGIAIIAILAATIVVFLLALAIAGVSLASRTAGLIVGIPLGLATVAVLIGLTGIVYVLWSLALAAIAIEEPNPVRAIAVAFRRTFGPLFWRGTIVGTSLIVIRTVFAYLFLALSALAVLLTQQSALVPIVISVGDVVVIGLVDAYIVVYALDVRIRREGYDLQLALAQSA